MINRTMLNNYIAFSVFHRRSLGLPIDWHGCQFAGGCGVRATGHAAQRPAFCYEKTKNKDIDRNYNTFEFEKKNTLIMLPNHAFVIYYRYSHRQYKRSYYELHRNYVHLYCSFTFFQHIYSFFTDVHYFQNRIKKKVCWYLPGPHNMQLKVCS